MLLAKAILVRAAIWDEMFSGSPCLTKMPVRTLPELLYLPFLAAFGGDPKQEKLFRGVIACVAYVAVIMGKPLSPSVPASCDSYYCGYNLVGDP